MQRDIKGEEVITTERLWLIPMIPKELENCLKDGGLIPPSILTEIIKNAIESKLEKLKEAPEEVYTWFTYFRIIDKESKQGIGLVGCKGLPDPYGFAELGYAMAPEYRNRDYMTEALHGFLGWLMQCKACIGAELNIIGANAPSLRVAEKCGFTYIEMYDIYKVYRNTWRETEDE